MTDEPSALTERQNLVQKQIAALELALSTGDALRIQKESAILAAYSRREAGVFTLHQTSILGQHLDSLTRTSLLSTEAVGAHMAHLSTEIRSFSDRVGTFADKADRGTNRLVVATWALTIAAIVAALIGAYVTLKVEPQIITVGKP